MDEQETTPTTKPEQQNSDVMKPQPSPSSLTTVEKISLLLGGIFISILSFLSSWFLRIIDIEYLRIGDVFRIPMYFVSFFALIVLYFIFRKRIPYLAYGLLFPIISIIVISLLSFVLFACCGH